MTNISQIRKRGCEYNREMTIKLKPEMGLRFSMLPRKRNCQSFVIKIRPGKCD